MLPGRESLRCLPCFCASLAGVAVLFFVGFYLLSPSGEGLGHYTVFGAGVKYNGVHLFILCLVYRGTLDKSTPIITFFLFLSAYI